MCLPSACWRSSKACKSRFHWRTCRCQKVRYSYFFAGMIACFGPDFRADRSLNSCKEALRSMQASLAAIQGQSSHHLMAWQALHGPALAPSLPQPVPVSSSAQGPTPTVLSPQKRSFSHLERSANVPRAIQPKPPQSASHNPNEILSPGDATPGYDSMPSRTVEPPRKRGRPKKSESERRRTEAESSRKVSVHQRRTSATKGKNPVADPGQAVGTTSDGPSTDASPARPPSEPSQPIPPIISSGEQEETRPGSSGRRSSTATTNLDPVRNIIDFQASQERRLGRPPELAPQGEAASVTMAGQRQ